MSTTRRGIVAIESPRGHPRPGAFEDGRRDVPCGVVSPSFQDALVLVQTTPAELVSPEPGAAVAIVIRERDEPELLLIQRAEREGDPWSGHMALPGGRRESQDLSLQITAARETQEEVGVSLDGCHWTTLGDVHTHKTGTVVRAEVFRVPGETQIGNWSEGEVADAFWTPFRKFVSGTTDTRYRYEYQGAPILFPGFEIRGRIVWGLTYRILRVFLHVSGLRGHD